MTGIELAPPDFVVSATQISTFELCPRKWAFRWLDGVESPPNKYAELGVETHGHLEDWLREGKVPVSDQQSEADKSVALAHALIPYLPPPQVIDPRNVELDQYYDLCGVKFILKVDLFMPQLQAQACSACGQAQFVSPAGLTCMNGHGGAPSVTDVRPRVFDHKTCGDFKWALPARRLREDVQGSLYGCWALHKTAAPVVDLQWNYARTKGAVQVLPVVATVTGRDVQDRVGKSLESARKMRVIAESGALAMQVEYDARGCAAFGGCPHQERCNLSPQEKMRSFVAQATAATATTLGETNMGSTEEFLASLAAGRPNGAQQAPAAAQAPMQIGPQQVPVQQAPMQIGVPAQQAPVQQAPMQPAQQQPMQLGYLQQPAPQQAPMQLSYPQQAPVQQAPAPQYVNPPAAPQPAQVPLLGQVAAQAPVLQPAAAWQPPVQGAQATPEEKRGRGRPAKASADDPWVSFASAALPICIQHNMSPENAADVCARYADALTAEHAKRK